MPHSNAAEALPPVPEDAEDAEARLEREYQEGLAEAEALKRETDEALKRETAESDEERRAKMEEARAMIEARENIDELPDMTLEAELEDPKDREEHYKKLERHFEAEREILEARKKREAEEGETSAFGDASPASAEKKGLWGRVKSLFSGR